MATFIEHKKTGRLFILISGSFGMYQSAANSEMSMRMKTHEQGTSIKVCVCDRKGELGWFNSDEIQVISVDGLDVKELKDLGFLEMYEKRGRFE